MVKPINILLHLTFLLFTINSSAQWEKTNGPLGGPFKGGCRVGDKLIAVSSGPSVYTSSDNGQSWDFKHSTSGYDASQVSMIFGKLYIPRYAYAQYSYSNDTGNTWIHAQVNPTAPIYGSTLYQFGGLLFYGASSSSSYTLSYMSADSGRTWTPRPGAGNVMNMYNGTINQYVSIGSALFAATTNGVFYTGDTGAIWLVRNGTGFVNSNHVVSLQAQGSVLYAVNSYGYVYRSADSAQTWQQITDGISPNTTGRTISTLYAYKGMMLGSSDRNDTLYRFNSTSMKWEAYSSDVKGSYGNNFFSYGDTLYMGSSNGLYYSVNNGQNWTEAQGKLSSLGTNRPIAMGHTVLAVDYNSQLHRSDNDGDTWYKQGPRFTNYVYSFFEAKGILYLSYYYDTKISTDTGRTWKNHSTTIPYISNNNALFAGNTFLYNSGNSLYSSADSGRTSTNITTNLRAGFSGPINEVKMINNTVWVSTQKYGLFRSTDDGASWLACNKGLPMNVSGGSFDTSVAWITNVGTALLCNVNDGGTTKNYISLDNGNNWKLQGNAYLPYKPTSFGGLLMSYQYFSADTGRTSQEFTTGFGATDYYGYVNTEHGLGSSYVFTAYGSFGIWRRPLAGLTDPPVAVAGNVEAVNQNNVKISWNKMQNTREYKLLESGTGVPGSFFHIATLYKTTDTVYNRSGLYAGEVRYYRIVAVNDMKVDTSAVFSGKSMDKPLAASQASATGISTASIMLKWKNNSTTASKFYIEMNTSNCCYMLKDSVLIGDTTYIVNNLQKNTTYWFRIRCKDEGGYSDYVTFSGRTNDTLPKAPVNLDAQEFLQTAIRLSWVDSSDNETAFVIERREDGNPVFTAVDSVNANIKQYTSYGLSASTRYHFRVRAKNSGGYSAYSNTDSADTYPAPAAASDLVITSVRKDAVVLSWTDNSNNETGFVIERAFTQNGTYTSYDSVAADVTSRNVTGLNPNTRYFFRVKTKDDYGYATPTNTVDTVTLPTAPAAPSLLSTGSLSTTSIRLNWADNSNNETYFLIEQSMDPVDDFEVIDSTIAGVSTYVVNNLNPATYYYYRVRAKNAGGFSSYSNYAMGVTNVNVPHAPTFLSEDDSRHNWVKFSWSDNSFNEVAFVVQRAVGVTSTVYTDFKTYPAGTTVGYDSTVTAGDVYKYRVYARNSAGKSANTNSIVVHVPFPLPAAPVLNAVAVEDHFTINISWTDAEADIVKYLIERKKENGAFTLIDSVSGNEKTYQDDALEAATAYTYRVRSSKLNAGYSAYSNEESGTTLNAPAGLPLPPNSLRAKDLQPNSITLEWRDSSDNEIRFYIERMDNSGFQVIDSVDANVTEYVHDNLDENTLYVYRVRAWNNTGYSAYSNVAELVTPFDLVAPEGLYIDPVSVNTFQLYWRDLSANETGFIIMRSLAPDTGFMAIDTVTANTTTYADFLPTKGIYYYRVVAMKGNTLSAPSNVAIAINQPTGLDDVYGAAATVYPNPATDDLYITGVHISDTKVEAYDNIGRMYMLSLTDTGNEQYKVDVSGLAAGLYFIRLKDGDAHAIVKFMKN